MMVAILVGIFAFIYCTSVYGAPGSLKSRGSPNFRVLLWGIAIGGWGVVICFFFSTSPPRDIVSILMLRHLGIVADVIGVGYGVVIYSLHAIFTGWIANKNSRRA